MGINPNNYEFSRAKAAFATITALTIIIVAVAIQSEIEAKVTKNQYTNPIESIKGTFNKIYIKDNAEPNQNQTKRDSTSGFLIVRLKDVSELLQLEASAFVRKLHIEPNVQQVLNVHLICDERFNRLESLHLSHLTFSNIVRCSQFDKTLKSLEIHHSDTVNLNDFIHSFPLDVLITLNLSHNSIRNTLNRFYFVNMTNVQQIILSHCLIEYLPSDTFHIVRKTIELIDLSSNRMTQLSIGFSSLITKSAFLTIRLDDNPWHCNCGAIANQLAYIRCLENCELSDNHAINWYSMNSINPAISKRDNRVHMESQSDTIDLQCEDLTNNQKSDTITLKRQTHNIRITFDHISKLEITIDGPETGYLIWFNDSVMITLHDDQSLAKYIQCNRVSSSITIDNVMSGTTYTFCVIPSASIDLTSPFNCVAYYVGEQYESENDVNVIWLLNDQKPMMICFFCALNLLLMLFGTLFGIYMIRKYPNCLIDKRNAFPSNTTNCFDKHSISSPPSVFSIDDNTAFDDYVQTYVTPKPDDDVEKLKKNQTIPYEIALGITSFDVIKSGLDTNQQYDISKHYWDNIQKLPSPPPLPGPEHQAAEDNNFSDKNSKELDVHKQLDLPGHDSNGTTEDNNWNAEPIYAECKFDIKNDVINTDNE